MAGIGRQLRRRRKMLLVWGALLLFAVLTTASRWCNERFEGRCLEKLSSREGRLALALLVLPFLALSIRRLLVRARERRIEGFCNQPWEYDQQVIEIVGKVEV